MNAYWNASLRKVNSRSRLKIRSQFEGVGKLNNLSKSLKLECEEFVNRVLDAPLLKASFEIGEKYTEMLPEEYRARLGIYFTPPSITNRLIKNIDETGFDWTTSKIIDPACGGGAFLSPVAIKIKDKIRQKGYSDAQIIKHIGDYVSGNEIDPFAAWMSQVFLELSLLREIVNSKQKLKIVVNIADTLNDVSLKKYDLVIGNPPYSKINLDSKTKADFSRSIYGHANLYGLFTDKAISLIKQNGLLAFITPASFLAGKYFKKLRKLITEECSPVCIDFIECRRSAFSKVLQETVIVVFKCASSKTLKGVSHSGVFTEDAELKFNKCGDFSLKHSSDKPWLIPRSREQYRLLKKYKNKHSTLLDYGYQVKTGPLVWNRNKEKLRKSKSKNVFPLIWGECIRQDGSLILNVNKDNRPPWVSINRKVYEGLITDKPCILMQRTTAKEQSSRLVCAIVGRKIIKEYGGVVAENHVNIIQRIPGKRPLISISKLYEILVSRETEALFRCLNGSTAVSAYELMSLPLPSVTQLVERVS